MTSKKLNNEYMDWLYDLTYQKGRVSYWSLLNYLNEKEFTYIIGLDGNRAEDGIDLRYRFAYEKGIPYAEIADRLDARPCSILEMMVALSIKCEEQIMNDSEIGDRTGAWFWEMVDNLGLGNMVDDRFNQRRADDILDRFLNRKYERNGKGGLFILQHCKRDLRSVEIWYQMMWYLDEVLEEEK